MPRTVDPMVSDAVAQMGNILIRIQNAGVQRIEDLHPSKPVNA